MQWAAEPSPGRAVVLADLALRAIADRPEEPALWVGLGRALAACGRHEEAVDHLSEAERRFPDHGALAAALASSLQQLGRSEEALKANSRALALTPDGADLLRRQFRLLIELGDLEGAALLERRVADLSPGFPSLLDFTARRRREDLLPACERMLAREPRHTYATFHRALILHEMGRRDEAASIEGLVELSELPAPEGFTDGAAFRTALAAEIEGLPRDRDAKSTRDGVRIQRLRRPEAPLVETLVTGIRTAVDRYAAGLAEAGHPFSRGQPKSVRIDIWATIHETGGWQAAHLHGSGWISGVYYVDAPPADGGGYDGPLLLGAVSDHWPAGSPWGVRRVEPVPGRLILFPSWLGHATAPAAPGGKRISVAFDIVPA